MSSFFGSKALIWGGTALFAATVISPQGTTKALNLMKTAGMQSRPGLLKKTGSSTSGGTTTTSTSTQATTTSSGSLGTTTTANGYPELDDHPVELRSQFGAVVCIHPTDVRSARLGRIPLHLRTRARSWPTIRSSIRVSRANRTSTSFSETPRRTLTRPIQSLRDQRPVDLHVAAQSFGLLDAGHARRQGQRRPPRLRRRSITSVGPITDPHCNPTGGTDYLSVRAMRAAAAERPSLHLRLRHAELRPGADGLLQFTVTAQARYRDTIRRSMTQAMSDCGPCRLPTTHLVAASTLRAAGTARTSIAPITAATWRTRSYGDWGYAQVPDHASLRDPDFTLDAWTTPSLASDDTSMWSYLVRRDGARSAARIDVPRRLVRRLGQHRHGHVDGQLHQQAAELLRRAISAMARR